MIRTCKSRMFFLRIFFIGGFLMVGILVAFLAGIASLFLSMPGLSLAVSAMFVLLMSGLILYQTSQIIHGGDRSREHFRGNEAADVGESGRRPRGAQRELTPVRCAEAERNNFV